MPFGRAIPNELRLQEQREERRHTVLLRTAKFIADELEFLCIIRDVSGSGVKLQLFHPVPRASSFVLEMPNGDRHSIELVWSEGEFSGFRFLDGSDGTQFIQTPADGNARKYIRLQNCVQGILKADGQITPISFINISQQGACIECDLPLALDQLVIADTGLLPPTFAKVRWRKRPHYGLIFEQVFRFEELARRLASSVQGEVDDRAEC